MATDLTLIAGVSNWGGYALALGLGQLCGAKLDAPWLSAAGQQQLIATLVEKAGAVDGRTLHSRPTVDGLSMSEYLAPLVEMRRICGLSP